MRVLGGALHPLSQKVSILDACVERKSRGTTANAKAFSGSQGKLLDRRLRFYCTTPALWGNHTRDSHTNRPKIESMSALQQMESTENKARARCPRENDRPSRTIPATEKTNVTIRLKVKKTSEKPAATAPIPVAFCPEIPWNE